MRPNFHVDISQQFTRPSFEESVNTEDVDEDDYLQKEVSCSKTSLNLGELYKFSKSIRFPQDE